MVLQTSPGSAECERQKIGDLEGWRFAIHKHSKACGGANHKRSAPVLAFLVWNAVCDGGFLGSIGSVALDVGLNTDAVCSEGLQCDVSASGSADRTSCPA